MLLLLAERGTRTVNRNNRMVKEADFNYSATIEQLESNSSRGIDPNMLAVLGTGNYVIKGESILITGAAGVSKTRMEPSLIADIQVCLQDNKEKCQTVRSKQRMLKCDIYDLMREKGYNISYSSFCKHIHSIDLHGKESFIRQI